jgi:hypothetical protein
MGVGNGIWEWLLGRARERMGSAHFDDLGNVLSGVCLKPDFSIIRHVQSLYAQISNFSYFIAIAHHSINMNMVVCVVSLKPD